MGGSYRFVLIISFIGNEVLTMDLKQIAIILLAIVILGWLSYILLLT